VFSDGEEGTTSDVRSEKRFRRRVNRAIEALRADIAGLRDDLEIVRRTGGRPKRREGILISLGRWVLRFVGVKTPHTDLSLLQGVLC